MQTALMDDRGRVTVGKKISKKYGKEFFIVEGINEVILVPTSKDPLKDLQEWGRKARFRNMTPNKIRRLAEEQAYKEIKAKSRRIGSK
jgi:hypothetical protein